MNLRLLTYNVFGMPWGYESISKILEWLLNNTDADIICLQEVFSKSERHKIEEFCHLNQHSWSCWFPDVEHTCVSRLFTSFCETSGLCFLVKSNIEVLDEPVFQAFNTGSGVDIFIRKGFFHISCKKDDTIFHVITTHFQSDFTECRCRVRYDYYRLQQEIQMYQYAKNLPNVLCIGDLNTHLFRLFSIVNKRCEVTFPNTEESLDHCLVLPESKIICSEVKYYHDVKLSDHIPILYSLRFTDS